MPYNRGEIALVLFPDSNLRTAKRRPVLVVQADNLNSGLSQTIVAMITSNLARAGHPSRVPILPSTPQGRQTGLLSDSVIMADNLATIRDSEFESALGRWPDVALVDDALIFTLEI